MALNDPASADSGTPNWRAIVAGFILWGARVI
jgi:hypothetical protein